jgi:hypothetical protein
MFSSLTLFKPALSEADREENTINFREKVHASDEALKALGVKRQKGIIYFDHPKRHKSGDVIAVRFSESGHYIFTLLCIVQPNGWFKLPFIGGVPSGMSEWPFRIGRKRIEQFTEGDVQIIGRVVRVEPIKNITAKRIRAERN